MSKRIRTGQSFLSTLPGTCKVCSSKKLPECLPHICGQAWWMGGPGSPVFLPWCWTKLVSQLSHFHLGFNEENVLLLNHFLELVTAISIQCQEGLTGTMKRCFNTCKFLETFTCHMLNLEFELVWQGGCATEAHSPCITKEAVSCLFKDKESTRQY